MELCEEHMHSIPGLCFGIKIFFLLASYNNIIVTRFKAIPITLTVRENHVCQFESFPQHRHVRYVLDNSEHGRCAKNVPRQENVKINVRVEKRAREIVNSYGRYVQRIMYLRLRDRRAPRSRHELVERVESIHQAEKLFDFLRRQCRADGGHDKLEQDFEENHLKSGFPVGTRFVDVRKTINKLLLIPSSPS